MADIITIASLELERNTLRTQLELQKTRMADATQRMRAAEERVKMLDETIETLKKLGFV